MPAEVGRIIFNISSLRLREAFDSFRDPKNQRELRGRLSEEQVETVIRLTQLFLDEVICNRDWSLQVWGWLCRLSHHIGDEHALSLVFDVHEVLRFKILNSDNYQVLFNGVEVGRAHKLPPE